MIQSGRYVAPSRLNELGYAMSLQRYYAQKAMEQFGNKKNIGSKQMSKKFFRKNRRGKKRGVIRRRVPRLLQSPTKLIKVKVSDYQAMTCTTGAIEVRSLQGNSIDDPFRSAGTGQPLGYDQWKALYRKAYVLGAKVKFTVYNNQSTALMYGITAIPENQVGSALTSYEHYIESPKTVSRLLSPDVDHGFLINKQSTKKMLHLSKIKDNDECVVNLVTETAPSKEYHFQCWIQPVDQTSTLTGVQTVIDIEYIVLLCDPILPSRSVET